MPSLAGAGLWDTRVSTDIHVDVCLCPFCIDSLGPETSFAAAHLPSLKGQAVFALLTPWLGSTPCLSLRVRRGMTTRVVCGMWRVVCVCV